MSRKAREILRDSTFLLDEVASSQLVQDSAYLVMVPNNVPETPPLRYNPVMAYCSDNFQKPTPFSPDVVVAIDSVIEKKYDAMHCHGSQMYEWIPWTRGKLDEVPAGDADRRAWLLEQRAQRDRAIADRFRDALIARYGKRKGSAVQYAEAFEGCEYGTTLDDTQVERIFGGM